MQVQGSPAAAVLGSALLIHIQSLNQLPKPAVCTIGAENERIRTVGTLLRRFAVDC